MTEFFLEARLTAQRFIVVEGPSDERFIRAWLQDVTPSESVAVVVVDSLEIFPEELFGLGLADGQRGRVIFTARRAQAEGVDLRCIADRDCGFGVDEHSYSTLLWTDFPAIESYAVDMPTLERANLLGFGGVLPDIGQVLAGLTFALSELYAVRCRYEHLARPNYGAGIGRKRDLASFCVALAVPPEIAKEASEYPRPSATDPREFAYGHDVGELLLSAYGNALKNRAGLSTLAAVEGALRAAIQAVRSYLAEGMFVRLETWVRS